MRTRKLIALGLAFVTAISAMIPTSIVDAKGSYSDWETEQAFFETYDDNDAVKEAPGVGELSETVLLKKSFAASPTVYSGVDYALVYDYDYYSSRYPDLKSVYGQDTNKYLKHFVESGMAEGRQGKESFDVFAYAANNKDLRAAFGNNYKSYYQHYIKAGAAEKRIAVGSHAITNYVKSVAGYDLSSIYDFNYYRNKYSDVKSAFGINDQATFNHFLVNGLKEGRIAKEDYDQETYNKFRPLGANLSKIKTTLWGVDFAPVYDYVYYMNNNADVAKAVSYDPAKALRHFADHGMYEGRKAKETYNQFQYEIIKAQYAPNRFKSDFPKAKAVLDRVGWDLKAAFNWSARMPYYGRNGLLPVVPDNGIDWFANFGFDNYKGNCYVAAATFYEMAVLLGYSPRQMAGMVPSSRGPLTPHSWVEIDIDGKTYVFDPNFDNGKRSGYMIWYGKSGTWRYTQYSPMHL